MSDAPRPRRLLGQILRARGVLREGEVQEALAEQRRNGGLLGQHLVALDLCTAADVAAAARWLSRETPAPAAAYR